MVNSRKQDNSAASSQTDATASNSCDISTPVPNMETLEAPEIFKEDAPVTGSVQVTQIAPGDGAEAKNGDCLVMKYYGTLAKDGTLFDENFTKDQALQFSLGGGQVIKGWDEGLVGIKVGETRRLLIPAELGYGSQEAGSIPANSDLVFVVKLEKIK
jgi:peptidylprolyl isomerase